MNDTFIPARFPAPMFDRAWALAFPDPMAIHCVLSLSGQIDETRLARAVRLTLDAEPILGCRFTEHWFRPSWKRYSTLEGLPYYEVRSSSNCQVDMRVFLAAAPHLPLQVLLLRGDSDMLCVKLDHRAGDGKALLDCTYLLVDIYNRLNDDPGYVPVSNVNGSRSLRQIGQRFSAREKWRIARHILQRTRENKKVGQWRYPIATGRQRQEFDYVSWRLDARQVRAIFAYGCQQGATVSQVLLAAFYLAAYEVLPRSPDLSLPVSVAIDLRRYLPSARASALCNLVGNCVIAIDPRSATSIDAVVEEIRDQMKSQQKYLGLAVSFFAFETLPIVRHLVGLIPYGLRKRSYRKQQELALPKDHVPGIVLVTHTGELDHERLVLGGTKVTEAFAVTGLPRIPGILGLAVSGFRGSLTLYLGAGPRAFVTRMAEHMKQVLETRTAAASKS